MVRLGLLGVSGRMGNAIVTELQKKSDIELVGAYARKGTVQEGVPIYLDYATIFPLADVIIDFTVPHALEAHLVEAKKSLKPMVVGITGLSQEHKQLLLEISKTIPLVYAENMSIGNTLMLYLTKYLARYLDESFDVEIVDVHHRDKIDSPSGTALALGRAVALERNLDFESNKSLGRSSVRKPSSIGFASLRGGTMVGEHMVSFFGNQETLKITHTCFDRKIFAQGALRAARWVITQPPGLYTMADVLGLHGFGKD